MLFNHKMTRLFLLVVLIIELSDCKPSAFFRTPNDVYKMEGAIHMKDGRIIHGKITILFENDIDLNKRIFQCAMSGDSVDTKINIDSVSYYSVGGQSYVAKNIDLYLRGVTHLLFVKRLNEENARMQLFELPQSYKSNDRGEEPSFFYISMSEFTPYDVIDINSAKLTPNFERNMSELVSDCPVLADKIRQKFPGYYFTYLSFQNKKLEIIKRIAKEYNNCDLKE